MPIFLKSIGNIKNNDYLPSSHVNECLKTEIPCHLYDIYLNKKWVFDFHENSIETFYYSNDVDIDFIGDYKYT